MPGSCRPHPEPVPSLTWACFKTENQEIVTEFVSDFQTNEKDDSVQLYVVLRRMNNFHK